MWDHLHLRYIIYTALDTNRFTDDLLIKIVEVKALVKPTERSHRHLQEWMVDHRPLREDEADFVYHVDDTVHLRRDPSSYNQHGDQLDTFIKNCLSHKPGSFLEVCISNSY